MVFIKAYYLNDDQFTFVLENDAGFFNQSVIIFIYYFHSKFICLYFDQSVAVIMTNMNKLFCKTNLCEKYLSIWYIINKYVNRAFNAQ